VNCLWIRWPSVVEHLYDRGMFEELSGAQLAVALAGVDVGSFDVDDEHFFPSGEPPPNPAEEETAPPDFLGSADGCSPWPPHGPTPRNTKSPV
jgi:hypothetical protein